MTSFAVDEAHERQPVGSVGEDVSLRLERVADGTEVVEYDCRDRAQTHRVDRTVPGSAAAHSHARPDLEHNLIAKFHYTDTDTNPRRTGHGQSPRTLSGTS